MTKTPAPPDPTPALRDDCFVLDQPRVTHARAIEILRARLAPVAPAETVDAAKAGHRVLAQTAVAVRNIPLHTNSAVDGYAFAHGARIEAMGAELPVSGRAAAGHALIGPASTGGAVRILTGAVLPPELDTVVMQEDVTLEDRPGIQGAQHVRIPAGSKRCANVRLAGEDVTAGSVLFEPGHVLRPQDLAALASAGLGQVRCYAPQAKACGYKALRHYLKRN